MNRPTLMHEEPKFLGVQLSDRIRWLITGISRKGRLWYNTRR